MANLSKEREKTLHVSLGSQCNNNCIFCMEPRFCEEAHRKSVAEHERFIRESKRDGFERVVFTQKEPTLSARKLLPLITLAKELGYTDIMLITNGRLLSYESFARKLIKSGVNHIEVSLHGSNQKIHESLTRTPGSFIETIMGINNLNKFSKIYSLRYSINYTITNINYENIPDFYRLATSFDPRDIIFNFYCTKSFEKRKHNLLLPKYSLVIQKLMEICKDEFKLIDFPFCIVPEELKDNLGHIEDFHLISEENPYLYRRNDWLESKYDLNACRSCKYEYCCPKPSREYIEKYGRNEFGKRNEKPSLTSI